MGMTAKCPRMRRRIPPMTGEHSAMPYLLDTLKLTALIVGPAVPMLALLFLPAKDDTDR